MIPVFIGGCDRSGTTLLGSILGNHSKCICVPESQFVIDVLKKNVQHMNGVDPSTIFKFVRGHPRFKIWKTELNITDLVEKVGCPEADYADVVRSIIAEYARQHGQTQASHWIDHTPTHIRHIHTLFTLFPNAKVVHLVRDGRAVSSSLLPLAWGPKSIDKAAYFWLSNLAFGLGAESSFGQDRVLRVHYEHLVLEPTKTIEKICSFIGVSVQPQMTAGQDFKLPSYTKKQHALVGTPPNEQRVAAWEHELSARQIEIFESVSGEMLQYLGYETKYGFHAKELTTIERIASTMSIFKMFAGTWLHAAKLYIAAYKVEAQKRMLSKASEKFS